MRYEKCIVELTDEISRYEIRATSFYVKSLEKNKKYNRAKDEKEFWRDINHGNIN